MEPWPNRLKRMRNAVGLSQAKLGERLGIKPSSVAQWEIGRSKPHRDRLPEISKIFKVSLDELQGTDLVMPEPPIGIPEIPSDAVTIVNRPDGLAEDTVIKRAIGTRIRWVREALGISQSKCSSALGISEDTLAEVERGDEYPSFLNLVSFCTRLRVSADYIIRGHIAPMTDEDLVENLRLLHPEIFVPPGYKAWDKDNYQPLNKSGRPKSEELEISSHAADRRKS